MELRPYQKESMESVFEQWEEVDKTLLVLPTGCGKTIVFAKITEQCVKGGKRVLILAHRGELLEQAADKIAKTTGLGCATEKSRTVKFEHMVQNSRWLSANINERKET